MKMFILLKSYYFTCVLYIIYEKICVVVFYITIFQKVGVVVAACQLRAHFNFLRGISVLLAFDTVFNSDLLQLC